MTLAAVTPIAPPIIVTGPDLSRVVDEGEMALRAADLYQYAGGVVEVIEQDPATRGIRRSAPLVRIHRCTEDRILELLALYAVWMGPDGAGGQRRVQPPRSVARMLLARGRWTGIRILTAIATAPTMRPDGTLVTAPGYDEASGIYLAPSVSVAVSERPTREEARGAVAALLEVVGDFPGSGLAMAAWLAGLLTAAVRLAIDGPVPMTIVEATVRGAGKGLLVDVAAVVVTGRAAARMVYSGDDAETRKVITAVAVAGDPIVNIDNVVGQLGCASLDAALTTPETWRDRVLGSTVMVELPLRITWYATGNGIIIGADLARRALLVRLEPQCERPEERTGFRYPRLIDHVRANRGALLSAALTIVRAYVVAGRPDMRLRPMGSFEAWSDLVRSALVWAGQPDPCGTISDLRASDVQADALRAAVEAWPAADGVGMTAVELVEMATTGSPWRAALIEWVPPRGGELPAARALSYALRRVRRRIVAGYMIDSAGTAHAGVARWCRLRAASGGDGEDGADLPATNAGDPFYGVGAGASSSSSPSSPRAPGEDDE